MTKKKLSFNQKLMLAFLAALFVGIPSIVTATSSKELAPAPIAVADGSWSGAE